MQSIPSGIYFARVKVKHGGAGIVKRTSRETVVFRTAKDRLSDKIKELRTSLGILRKQLDLPAAEQGNQILTEVEIVGAVSANDRADFARFLACSGCRFPPSAHSTLACGEHFLILSVPVLTSTQRVDVCAGGVAAVLRFIGFQAETAAQLVGQRQVSNARSVVSARK